MKTRSTLTAATVAALLLGGLLLLSKTSTSPERSDIARDLAAESARPVAESLAPLVPDADVAGATMSTSGTRQAVSADPRESQRTLVALVRNADGRPVDDLYVRVGVGDRGNRDLEALTEETDENGLAHFAAADVERVQAQSSDSPLRIELGPRTHEPVVRLLEPGVIPAEPVLLEVNMMRLVVRAVTPEGEPWTGRLGLSVQPDDYHYYSTAGPPPRIGWVPRGHGYKLRVYGCGLYEDGKEHFPAPGMVEAQREHDIVLGPPMPALTGRIVDAQGRPLPEGTNVSVLDRGRIGNGSRWVSVRRDGRFEYTLRLGESSGQVRLFEFTLPRDGQMHEYGAFAARVTFEVGPPGEPLDLGTIVLEEQPLLAAGRITAPDGVRLKGIGIIARVLGDSGWRQHPTLDNCVWISEEGEFAIYGEDLPGPERLHVVTAVRGNVKALTPGCDLNFTPGSRELVVPLVEPGTLAARIDPVALGIGRRATFRIHVRPAGSGPMDEYALPDVTVLASRGALEHRRVPPGKARLELLASDGGAPIASWTDIEIRAGETTDLGDLSLNGNVRVLRLRLNGTILAPVQVRYGAHGIRPLQHKARVADSVAELVAGPSPLDVLIFGTDIAPRLLESVSLDMEVELQKGVSVQVRFDGAADLVEAFRDADPEHQLRVVFEPKELGLGGAFGAFDFARLATSRDFSLGRPLVEGFEQPLPGPGMYIVRLELPRAADVLRNRPTPAGLAPTVSLPALSIGTDRDPAVLDIDLRPLLSPVPAIRFDVQAATPDSRAAR